MDVSTINSLGMAPLTKLRCCFLWPLFQLQHYSLVVFCELTCSSLVLFSCSLWVSSIALCNRLVPWGQWGPNQFGKSWESSCKLGSPPQSASTWMQISRILNTMWPSLDRVRISAVGMPPSSLFPLLTHPFFSVLGVCVCRWTGHA